MKVVFPDCHPKGVADTQGDDHRSCREMCRMKKFGSSDGFTVVEMAVAVVTVGILSAIYFFMIDGYRERRMSEQAAKVLMLAAKAEEDFFAREHRYFEAEVSGSGDHVYLVTPDGKKTSVLVPPRVILSLKTTGGSKPAFTGQAFYMGSKALHRYDSETGKITTTARNQDDSG